ncbi:DNA-binding protein [Halobacillus ihumii]|uniref:DNA-binding protein n=1 Tax=Halobacillus ihumii TaxID=2686092 RepID=UPI0013D40BB2|nr:DNA-binding protein [Halobacillus ihumii]
MNDSYSYGFFAKEVALKLDIKPSTLRQWALALEEEGYEFQRNDKEQRIYYDRDISMFFELKKCIEKKRNRQDAIKAVAKQYRDRKNAEKTLSVLEQKPDPSTLSKQDFQSIINEAVERAYVKGKEDGKQETQMLFNKMDERLEARDRRLLDGINQRVDKFLTAPFETAATKEKDEEWSKMDEKLIKVLKDLEALRQERQERKGWKFWKW